MKFTFTDIVAEDPIIEVKNASYLDDFVLSVMFSDGSKRLVDFKPFLTKSEHPSIMKYLDETVFKNFTISDGNITWNNYDMIFPISDLHEGFIQ